MRIDCKSLQCPEPILKARQALGEMAVGELLEIEINSEIVRENLLKFFKFNQLEVSVKSVDGGYLLSLIKSKELKDELEANEPAIKQASPKKVIYINEKGAGSGSLGADLISKLLASFVQLAGNLHAVVLVNEGVFISTNRAHPALPALKELEKAGVRVLSCGACLQGYGLLDKLVVGEVSNAFEIAQLLINFDEIKL